MKKYEFTGEEKEFCGHTLRRIRALVAIGKTVSPGDLGGWIETESNLSQDGDAWVGGNAEVYGNAEVCGKAEVCGNAVVCGNSDYSVFQNTWSSMRWFTYTASNKMWKVGCFFGTGDELIKKAYADSQLSGMCYESIVLAQEAIEKAKENKLKGNSAEV